jgi:hypothetical protein
MQLDQKICDGHPRTDILHYASSFRDLSLSKYSVALNMGAADTNEIAVLRFRSFGGFHNNEGWNALLQQNLPSVFDCIVVLYHLK